jgi:hypothetical protein
MYQENLPDSIVTALVEHINTNRIYDLYSTLEVTVFNSRLPQPAIETITHMYSTGGLATWHRTNLLSLFLKQAQWLPDAMIYEILNEHCRLCVELLKDTRNSDVDDYAFGFGAGNTLKKTSKILASQIAILPDIKDYFLKVLRSTHHVLSEQALDALSDPDLVDEDVLEGLAEVALRARHEDLCEDAAMALYGKSTLPVHYLYAAVKALLSGSGWIWYLAYRLTCRLNSSPGVDLWALIKDGDQRNSHTHLRDVVTGGLKH